MRQFSRDDLKLAIDLACGVFGDSEMVVVGSMSILGHDPKPPAAICLTMDIDLYPKNAPGTNTALLAIEYGEGSLFRQENGWYIEALAPWSTAFLPPGWSERTNPIETATGNVGHCLAPMDLAVNKTRISRKKDFDQVKAMIEAGYFTFPALKDTFLEHVTKPEHREIGMVFLERMEKALASPRPEIPRVPGREVLFATPPQAPGNGIAR
jgi:hypothetical protein